MYALFTYLLSCFLQYYYYHYYHHHFHHFFTVLFNISFIYLLSILDPSYISFYFIIIFFILACLFYFVLPLLVLCYSIVSLFVFLKKTFKF